MEPRRVRARPTAMKPLLLAIIAMLALTSCSSARDAGEHAGTDPAPSPSTPQALELKAPAPAAAKCMAPTGEALRSLATYAFAGTVSELKEGQATLQVEHWYVGGDAPVVNVTAPAPDMQALIGAVDLQQGKRYLLAAGEGDTLLVCGFSAPETASSKALYADAFPG